MPPQELNPKQQLRLQRAREALRRKRQETPRKRKDRRPAAARKMRMFVGVCMVLRLMGEINGVEIGGQIRMTWWFCVCDCVCMCTLFVRSCFQSWGIWPVWVFLSMRQIEEVRHRRFKYLLSHSTKREDFPMSFSGVGLCPQQTF